MFKAACHGVLQPVADLLHDVVELVFRAGLGAQRVLCIVSVAQCVALATGEGVVPPTQCFGQACAQAIIAMGGNSLASEFCLQPGSMTLATSPKA